MGTWQDEFKNNVVESLRPWQDKFKDNLFRVLFRDDQPRDELGRWTTTGPGAAYDEDAGGWRDDEGNLLSDTDQARLKAMGTPKAWTDVRLNPDPDAARQVVGKDSKGRTQSRYRADAQQATALEKFARVSELNDRMGQIQEGVYRDMQDSSLSMRDRDSAACVALITETGVRSGASRDAAAEHATYGAMTLEGRHITGISGDTVTLEFVGAKAGGEVQMQQFSNKQLAGYLKGKDLGYNDRVFDVTPASLKTAMERNGGSGFFLKDIRTWKGTDVALQTMAELPTPTTKKMFRSGVKQVAAAVSERLGNTPTVALKSYINPEVFHGWESAALDAR